MRKLLALLALLLIGCAHSKYREPFQPRPYHDIEYQNGWDPLIRLIGPIWVTDQYFADTKGLGLCIRLPTK